MKRNIWWMFFPALVFSGLFIWAYPDITSQWNDQSSAVQRPTDSVITIKKGERTLLLENVYITIDDEGRIFVENVVTGSSISTISSENHSLNLQMNNFLLQQVDGKMTLKTKEGSYQVEILPGLAK